MGTLSRQKWQKKLNQGPKRKSGGQPDEHRPAARRKNSAAVNEQAPAQPGDAMIVSPYVQSKMVSDT